MYLKNGKGQRTRKQRRGKVQICTVCVQQIGRTFSDKGEKDGKEIGQSPNKIP